MEDKKMKKFLSNIMLTAALLVAGAAVVSCEKENPPVEGTFTMTVEASMPSGGGAKQLTLDGSTLHATWAVGERVTVRNITKNADLEGYLEARSNGAHTTLSGSLTGTIQDGDELKLMFLSPDYGSQNGTLEYIATHCDYAEATVTVSHVTAGGNITTTGHANFVNQQAIVKFTLKNTSNEAISVTPLKVSDGTHTYTITPASATSEIFVALPGFSGQTVCMVATAGGSSYDYIKSGVSFTNGQYYEITVKMNQVPTGALTGRFTVNASGKQVRFAQGNLQHISSTWQFATNQYDYYGEDQDGHQDMFAYNNYTCPDSWYVLSNDEWVYLLSTRSVSNTLYSGALFTKAHIGSINGLIIFPDNYVHPDGTGFTAGTYNGHSDFTASVSTEGWAKMEAAGCVFLPACGYKSKGQTWHGVGSQICYSSSSQCSESLYYDPYFYEDGFDLSARSYLSTWTSVRPVRDVE